MSSAFAAAAAPSPISTAQYLSLLHPPASRGNAFLSGPAASEAGGDDYRWRDVRCAPDTLAGAGERFAVGREGKYVSMARYGGPWRREEALAEIGSLWIDVDYYRVKSLESLTPEQVLFAIRERLEGARVPAPSLVLRSGRGLLLVWLHDAIPAKALPRWKAVQHKLSERLPGFGVDKSGLTPTKVFRVPGSLNRGEPVTVLHPASVGDVVRWSFDDLAREILPHSRNKVRKRRAARKAQAGRLAASPTRKPKDGEEPWADYYRKVAGEIERLKHLRFGDDPVAPGARDLFSFTLGCCAAWSTPADALEARLSEIGAAVIGWSERENRSCVCSLLNRARRAARGEKGTWKGKAVDLRYRLSGARVADLLEVTAAEVRELALVYVAPTEEKAARRRDAVRRCREKQGVKSRARRSEERAALAVQAEALLAAGATLRMVSMQLGVAASTLSNALGERRRRDGEG